VQKWKKYDILNVLKEGIIMNIFITGIPRAGKTTFSRKLKEKYPKFNIMVTEAVRNGFQKAFPNLKKDFGIKSSAARNVTFPEFMGEFLYWNNYFSHISCIVDSALLTIEQIEKIKHNQDIVLCFGFGGIENTEIWNNIQKHQLESDYTVTFNKEKMFQTWGDVCLIDKENLRLCEELNIKYFNTSKNMDDVLNEALIYVETKLNLK